MDTCILFEMGPFIPPFAILKPKVERFDMMHVVCQQEKNTCTFYLFNKMLTIYFNTKCSRWNTNS